MKNCEKQQQQEILFSDALRVRAIKCTDVILAYQWRAFKLTNDLNCVTWFLLEANAMAAKMEDEYHYDNDSKPPLFGIPFSVKENFEVAIATQHLSLAVFNQFVVSGVHWSCFTLSSFTILSAFCLIYGE